MIGLLIKLLLLSLVLYVIVYVYKAVKKFLQSATNPMRPTDACPSCGRSIQVSGEEMICPYCETKLGRTKEGKLVKRVN
jgi:tRNA(Ile2) C34 agmatinyltransferase TiaS